LIGKFNGPAYIRYACKAGRHIFWARSENKNFVEADVEAGKIYFIEAIVNMGAIKAAVRLDPLDPDDQKRMKSVLKLIAKEPSESFSDDELRAQEKKMEAIITRGLEKYNADKQKGRTLARLNKDMYYKK
jgi:Fe-S-cluster formation regulator IscX/YfhJ